MSEEEAIEAMRMHLTRAINSNPKTREQLEAEHGAEGVWDTKQLQETFQVHGFAAPFCKVTRKSDGAMGAVMFQHAPRFYYDFKELGS